MQNLAWERLCTFIDLIAIRSEGEPPAKRVKYTLQSHSEGAAVIQVSRDLIMADAVCTSICFSDQCPCH